MSRSAAPSATLLHGPFKCEIPLPLSLPFASKSILFHRVAPSSSILASSSAAATQMSSAGTHVGAADAAAIQHYFCHQCDRTVALFASTSEIACPICHGGFLEEVDLPVTNPNLNSNASSNRFFSYTASPDPFFLQPSPFPLLFAPSSSSPVGASFDLRNPSDLAGFFSSPDLFVSRSAPAPQTASPGTVPFNPMLFLQDYIQQLVSGGANIQVVIEGGHGGSIGNLGDYFIGPGLEQLIQQLAENDPNRYGTPPAAKSAILSLPDIKITGELLASDEAQCSVCMDTFEMGDEAKQMPCKHIFHKGCILPWLELHNSCPVCRFELPTDDLDYEQRRGASAVPSPRTGSGTRVPTTPTGSGAEASAEGDSPSPRIVERRFRISLPWPLRIFGAQSEGSNTGDGGGGTERGSNTDGNSGRQGDGRSETRQEDLD